MLPHLILACRSRLPLTTREEERRPWRHRPWQEPHPRRQDSWPPRRTHQRRRPRHRCPPQRSRLSSCPPAAHRGRNLRGKKNLKRCRKGRTGNTNLSLIGLCVQDGRKYGAHELSSTRPPTAMDGQAQTNRSRSDWCHLAGSGGVYLAPTRKYCRRLCRAPRPCSPPWTARSGPVAARPNLNGRGGRTGSSSGSSWIISAVSPR